MRIVPRGAPIRLLFTALVFAAVAGGSALPAAEPAKAADSAAEKYTATATLLLERHDPHILSQSAEKDNPAEFDYFRATQMQLIKSCFVIQAALRDPKLKNRPSILREDARHHVMSWLTKGIRVECPDPRAGLVTVSFTGDDPQEAAAVVNAVVDAYMSEVVNYDRQRRRERLSELQEICAEKEIEIRNKREQLKRELENIGIGDEQTSSFRTELAMNVYAEFLREFHGMRAEHRNLVGQLTLAKRTLMEVRDFEIPEIEVAAVLNNNPRYRDLQNRLAFLAANGLTTGLASPETKEARLARTEAELHATKAQIEKLENDTRDHIRGALRIELQNEVRRLEHQVEISAEQLTSFEKEVERKANEADNVGRSSIAIQMARADVDSVERILRSLTDEKEKVRVELKAPPRVRVLGDPNCPAAVPESPD